jgi:isochorismate hydrolase
VLSTASEAYMREFELVVPPDAVASFCGPDHEAALRLMASQHEARLTRASEVDFVALCRREPAENSD